MSFESSPIPSIYRPQALFARLSTAVFRMIEAPLTDFFDECFLLRRHGGKVAVWVRMARVDFTPGETTSVGKTPEVTRVARFRMMQRSWMGDAACGYTPRRLKSGTTDSEIFHHQIAVCAQSTKRWPIIQMIGLRSPSIAARPRIPGRSSGDAPATAASATKTFFPSRCSLCG